MNGFWIKLSVSDSTEYTDNPDLFIGIGDFYYAGQNFAKAIEAYGHAIALAPDSAACLK